MVSAVQWLTTEHAKKYRVFDVYGPDSTICTDVLASIELRVDAQETVRMSAGTLSDDAIWQRVASSPMVGVSSRLMVIRDPERIKSWSGFDKFLDDRASFSETTLLFVSSRAEAGRRVRSQNPKVPGKSTWTTELTPWEERIRSYSSAVHIECATPSIELPLVTGNRGGPGALSPAAKWLCTRVMMNQKQAEYLWRRAGHLPALARDVADQLRLFGKTDVQFVGISDFTHVVDSILTAHGPEDFAELLLFGQRNLALASIADHEFSSAEWSKILGYLSQRLDWLGPLHVALATKEKLDQVQRRLNIHRKWILQYAHREDTTRNIAKHYDDARVSKCRRVIVLLDAALSSFKGVPPGFGEYLIALW